MTVVKADAVPKFVNLLQSPYTVVAEQSVWALGNIAGDGPITRDIVLKHGAAESLLKLLEQNQPVSEKRAENHFVKRKLYLTYFSSHFFATSCG